MIIHIQMSPSHNCYSVVWCAQGLQQQRGVRRDHPVWLTRICSHVTHFRSNLLLRSSVAVRNHLLFTPTIISGARLDGNPMSFRVPDFVLEHAQRYILLHHPHRCWRIRQRNARPVVVSNASASVALNPRNQAERFSCMSHVPVVNVLWTFVCQVICAAWVSTMLHDDSKSVSLNSICSMKLIEWILDFGAHAVIIQSFMAGSAMNGIRRIDQSRMQ